MSINRGMDKENVVDVYIYVYGYIMHTHSGMLLCHLEQHGWNWRVLCLVKKAEKDKYCIISLI